MLTQANICILGSIHVRTKASESYHTPTSQWANLDFFVRDTHVRKGNLERTVLVTEVALKKNCFYSLSGPKYTFTPRIIAMPTLHAGSLQTMVRSVVRTKVSEKQGDSIRMRTYVAPNFVTNFAQMLDLGSNLRTNMHPACVDDGCFKEASSRCCGVLCNEVAPTGFVSLPNPVFFGCEKKIVSHLSPTDRP